MELAIDREDRARRIGLVLLTGVIVLFAAAKAIHFDTLDPDLFWHLRVADQLERQGIHPLVDDISYMSKREPWTPYSWLAELFMKSAWDTVGWRGVVGIQSVLQAGFATLVAISAMRRSKWSLSAVVACVFAAYLSLPFLSFRPVTMAFVVLAGCALLILRDREMDERSRAVWFIVPLTALAINLHFFAIFVPTWCGLLWIGNLIERRPARRAFLLTFATGCACLMTPLLPGVIKSVFYYGAGDPMVSAPFIVEFHSPFTGLGGAITGAMVLAVLFCCIQKRHEIRVGEWLWLIFSTLILLKMGRFLPIYVLIAAPLLAQTMPRMEGKALGRKPIMAVVAIVLIAGIARVVISFPATISFDKWLARLGPNYPIAAADYVQKNVPIPSGKIINEFNWGGYLAWKFDGDAKVFVDGRTQLYSPQFWNQTYLKNAQDAVPLLKSSGADVAIIQMNRSRFRDSLKSLGWKRVYNDDLAEVLVPPNSAVTSIKE
jgi:hypothetical protein